MKFKIDDLVVYFPYEYIYPEQYNYMIDLKRALDAKGHCLLEMPSGTGKTVTLLALITSYQMVHPHAGKLVYCTRTVPEMEKVLRELHHLVEYQKSAAEDENVAQITAIGLSARKNLCIHPSVANEDNGAVVDAQCRNMTAPWARERAINEGQGKLCDFFEGLESASDNVLPPGVYSLEELKEFGRAKGWCPYFLARRAMEYVDVIVYNYSYLLDPKVSSVISKNLPKDSIVVFDEAHNIDNVCIDALSVNIDQHIVERSIRNLHMLKRRIDMMKRTNTERLKSEYNKLVDGLASAGIGTTERLSGNPVIPSDILTEAVPGNMRKGEHFVSFLRRFVSFVKDRLSQRKVIIESPESFLSDLFREVQIDQKPLRFCSDRLLSLFNTLELEDLHDYQALRVIADFGSLIGTYQDGFKIIMEPFDPRFPDVSDPIFQFCCLDASIGIKPVFDKFNSVVITSGTLSPLDFYPKILNFTPVISNSFSMSMTRNCICPMIVSRGSDQVAVSTRFNVRNDPSVVRNYGGLIAQLSEIVPDGIICFFTSYSYLEETITNWNDMGIIDQISRNKLIFIETQNVAETSLALENYRKACDSGRGAVFFSIARGKVAEGIDFDGHYGRAVVMFGIPFVYTQSEILKARLEYLRERFQVRERDFLAFDAIRQAAQCIGRVIRNKTDYGLMILADKRFNRIDKRSKLPKWIGQFISDSHLNLSTDTALGIARQFLREMAQPWAKDQQLGVTLWTEKELLSHANSS